MKATFIIGFLLTALAAGAQEVNNTPQLSTASAKHDSVAAVPKAAMMEKKESTGEQGTAKKKGHNSGIPVKTPFETKPEEKKE